MRKYQFPDPTTQIFFFWLMLSRDEQLKNNEQGRQKLDTKGDRVNLKEPNRKIISIV